MISCNGPNCSLYIIYYWAQIFTRMWSIDIMHKPIQIKAALTGLVLLFSAELVNNKLINLGRLRHTQRNVHSLNLTGIKINNTPCAVLFPFGNQKLCMYMGIAYAAHIYLSYATIDLMQVWGWKIDPLKACCYGNKIFLVHPCNHHTMFEIHSTICWFTRSIPVDQSWRRQMLLKWCSIDAFFSGWVHRPNPVLLYLNIGTKQWALNPMVSPKPLFKPNRDP